MTIEEFSEELTGMLEDKLGDDYRVCYAENVKNNGIILHGVTIRRNNEMVSPTIYTEPFYIRYNRGMSIEEISENVLSIYHDNNAPFNFDFDYFTDFNKIKDRICFKLCNTEKNSELLRDIPSVPFKDLSIVFYIFISNDAIGNGQVLIKNDLFAKWNIKYSELMDYALTNTPKLLGRKFCNIINLLEDMAKRKGLNSDIEALPDFEMLKGENPSLYVLSNQESFNGASCILYEGEMEKLSNEIGDSYFIIPSSIHELIIVPENMEIEGSDFNGKCNTLLDMIHNVNLTEVPESDFLSDNLYYYDKTDKNLSVIDSALFTAADLKS